MKDIIKRIFCNHEETKTITNFYGDYIDVISRSKIYRSERQCKKCGKRLYSEYLDKNCKIANYKKIN